MKYKNFLLMGFLLAISSANGMEEKRQKVEAPKAEEPKRQIPSLMTLSNKAIAKQLLVDCSNDSAAIFNWLNTSDITTQFKVEITLNMLEQVSEQDVNTDIVAVDVALLMHGSLVDPIDEEWRKKLFDRLHLYTYRSLFVACYRISTFTQINNAQELSKNALIHILKSFRNKILESEVNVLVKELGAKKIDSSNLIYLVDTLEHAEQLQKEIKKAFHDKRKPLISALEQILSYNKLENRYMLNFINICAEMMSCTIKSITPSKKATISGLSLLRQKTNLSLISAESNKPEALKIFLGQAKIATKNNRYSNLLSAACDGNSKEVVKLLLEKGVFTEEDFQHALEKCDIEIVKLLFAYGKTHNKFDIERHMFDYTFCLSLGNAGIDKLELIYSLVMKASIQTKLLFLHLAVAKDASDLFLRCLASIDSLSFISWKALFAKAIENGNTAISEALLKVKLDGYDEYISLIADKFPEQDRLN